MQQQAITQAATKLSESYDDNCEALLYDEHMIQVFGKRYASCPEKFEFLPGEKDCIKKIAAHVKKLVDDGTGEKLFKQKGKKQMKSDVVLRSKDGHTKDYAALFKELYSSASNCLKIYNVDMTTWSEKCVEVDTTGAAGSIFCILCDNEENETKPKPKRVSYCFSKKRSGFWALANFRKHLENVHLLKINRTNEEQPVSTKRKLNRKRKCISNQTVSNVKDDSIQKDSSTPVKVEDTIISVITETTSAEIDSSIEFIALDDTNSSVTHEATELWLHAQISEQITEMVAAVLINGEKQKPMEFQLKNQPSKYLSVITTAANGDCLFSALAHQLWKNKINHNQRSKGEHEKVTKNLRSAVVKHILRPDNFHLYEPALQQTVSELKLMNVDDDLTATCKSFVRDTLSCEGSWGGLETIKAVSVMHSVNVLVVNECGTCYLIKGAAKKYDRTLLIAYRMYYNDVGDPVYNHYDSISDICSDDMISVADVAINKFKSK